MSAALVGVVVFLKRQSLVGEALSHASYPGVILGVILAGAFDVDEGQELSMSLLIMSGALVTSLAGLWSIGFLERRMKVRSDSALCFVLAVFFGVGLTLASHVQFTHSSLYRQAQVYLYGQAATMTDVHMMIYGLLSVVILAVIFLFYKEIQAIAFDSEYARSIGINKKLVDSTVFFLVVVAVVIGIRSVGVVLMSAMLIAPAAAARQFSNNLYKIFTMAALFGALSGFFGNYYSVQASKQLAVYYPGERLTLPTGPMIVVVASLLCLLSLLFAPGRGIVLRFFRVIRFRYRCMCENLLKAIWRHGKDREISFEELARHQSASPFYLRFVLYRLSRQGWVSRTPMGYKLTSEGVQWASRIVRLHRLWEVYLVDYLGVGAERVHRSAEEMEHIITPELEAELMVILNNPKVDPHHQPIPQREEG